MLPLTNILMPELPTSDKLLNNNNLLPQDAIVPDASFGDLLVANLVELTEPAMAAGDALPLDGNAMPAALAERPIDPVIADLPVTPAFTAAPEPAALDMAAPTIVDDLAPLQPAAPPTTAQLRATRPDGQEPLMTFGEPKLASLLPQAERAAIVETAHAAVVSAQPQTRSVTPAVEPQLLMPEGRAVTEVGAPRIAASAATQQALTGDAGGQRHDDPADSAERLARDFLAPRLSPDANSTPRAFEPVRDEAMQNFRTLQQLNQQLQPTQSTQQPTSVAAPAVSPAALAPPQFAPVTLPPAAEAALSLNTPVTDAAWGEQIGERVVLMANRNLQNAEIRLSPAELGPLRIQVRVDDGAANVTFHATHAVTREAIEQAIPRLREMFVENGLNLGEANVNEQGIGPQADTGRDAAGQSAVDGTDEGEALSAVAVDSAEQNRARRVIDGLVDTFA